MSRTGAFVVTGAGSGIGRAISAKLIEQGRSVFGLGRDPGKLERLAEEFPHDRFAFAAADLSVERATLDAVGKIRNWLEERDLPLLGLVNNAGIFERTAFLQTSDAIWERFFQNNLLSAVRLTRELYPDLKTSSPSSVLNISSSLGVRPVANTSAYSALKAAMVNWTQSLAIEWGPYGIRANCICPGIVDTPIHSALPSGVPIGRPEDIAEAAWFLLSESSSWTTGSILKVDGGISL